MGISGCCGSFCLHDPPEVIPDFEKKWLEGRLKEIENKNKEIEKIKKLPSRMMFPKQYLFMVPAKLQEKSFVTHLVLYSDFP